MSKNTTEVDTATRKQAPHERVVMRDPLKDPMPLDQIKQSNGTLMRVTDGNGDSVSWQVFKGFKWVNNNTWTVKGWSEMVCNGATVVNIADA